MRLKSEANQNAARIFEATAAQESKRFEKSAGGKGMTVLGKTDITKLESADLLVTYLSTPPVQEDRSKFDSETAQGPAKPESEDGREVVSPIPTRSPLISASEPASSDKTAELSLERCFAASSQTLKESVLFYNRYCRAASYPNYPAS